MVADYDLVVVARIPKQTGAPALDIVDPIDWTSLSYSDELNQAQSLTATALVSGLTEPVLERLRALAENATELWLYRDAELVFAGPLMGWSVDSTTITFNASGLLAYLRWMVVDDDLNFTSGWVQLEIVKFLIDQWQDGEYGHFGITTGDNLDSGNERVIEYIKHELIFLDKAIDDLSKQSNGFDYEIDPARNLRLWYPKKGVDRSVGDAAIVFDDATITSSNVVCSAGPSDIATVAFATTSADQETRMSIFLNGDRLITFGRSVVAKSFDKVEETATDDGILNRHAVELLDAYDNALLVPGPTTRVTADTDLSLYSEGDTVQYALNNQMRITGAFRVRKRTVSVSRSTGLELAAHEFV